MTRIPMPAEMPADVAERLSDPIDPWDPSGEYAERAMEDWIHDRANQIIDDPKLLKWLVIDWQVDAMPEYWRQLSTAARAGEFRRWLLESAKRAAADEFDTRRPV